MKHFLPQRFSRLKPIVLLAGFLLFLLPQLSWGQLSIGNTTTPSYTEAFTSFAGAATPTNWTVQGTGTRGTTWNGSTLTAGSGGWYGNANMAFQGTTSSATNGNATWLLKNTSGAIINGFTLSFIGRNYASNTGTESVTVSYSTSTTSTIPAAGALTNPLNSLSFSDATANISSGVTFTQTVSSISIANNDYILIRFRLPGGANADNLGWDDVKFEPTFAPVNSNSSASNIIANAGFTYPTNIDFISNTAANVTTANPEVFKFDIQDGGGAADVDNVGTILNSITFAVTGSSTLQRVALYDGNTELAEVAAGSSLTFTGLTVSASDDNSKSLSLRATYNTTVADNTQFSFTVSSTTTDAGGSNFAATNAGAATSSVSGDNNRIEVTASQFAFTTQPSSTVLINTNLGTSGVVTAKDSNGNTDVDYAGTATITNSVNLAINTTSATFASGLYTFPAGFQFSQAGTTTLTVAEGSKTATSSSIVVSNPTITSVARSGSSPYCGGSTTTITFTTSASFNPSNTFTVELSDNTSSFANPIIIGSGTASPIVATLPANATSGSNHRIRVVSSDPVVTSSLTPSFTITANPAVNSTTISTPNGFQDIALNGTGTAIFATPSGPSTYIWRFGSTSGNYTTTINGATSASYTPAGADFVNTGTYYLVAVATTTCGNVTGTSNEVIINVLAGSSAESKAVEVTSSETATLSSLINTNISSNNDGSQVWQVKLFDGDGTNDDADGLPTKYTGFTFAKGGSNTVSDWSATIQSLQFFEDNNSTPIATSSLNITASNIVVTFTNPIEVLDGAASFKTLSMRLSVKNPLPALSDNKIFQFSLTKANILTGSATVSSQLQAATFTINSAAAANKIAVEATNINFVQQPTDVATNTSISPAVTVAITDANGNRDLDGTVSITSNGATLQSSPVTATVTAASGLYTFSTLKFSTFGTNVTLSASINTPSISTSSNTFTVTAGPENYTYRSLRTGTWESVIPGTETWERTLDGSTWNTVTNSADLPTSASGAITILSGHEVTVASSTSADQLTIATGGTLTIGSSSVTLTINDGAGTDLNVDGTVKNSGSITQNTGSTTAFNSSAFYYHISTAGFGVIPIATWDIASTCEINITGSGGAASSGNYGQSFGNLRWNSTLQNATVQLSSALTTVRGNLDILSTNSKELRLSAGTNLTLTVGGNLRVYSNSMLISTSTNTAGTWIYNVGGNFQVDNGGTISHDNTSARLTVNFTGANKTFTNNGTLTGANINWTVASGAQLTLASDFSVESSRSLTVNGQLNTGNYLVKGAGTFTLAATGTLGIGSAAGITSSGATGSIQTTGTRTFNASTFIYNGTVAQNTGNGLPTTINHLTVNNSAGLTLTSPLIITNTLNLTNGIIKGTNTNSLTVASTGSSTVGNTNSYVEGPLAQIVATTSPTTLNFPVGKAGKFRPITLDVTQSLATTTTYTAEQKEGAPTPRTLDGTLDKVSSVRYFSISQNPVNTLTEGFVRLSYGADDMVTDPTMLSIAKSDASGNWIDLGNATASNGTILSANPFYSFSDFVLANKTGGTNPLPVELINFTATSYKNAVELNWATASEKNSDRFEVERSVDGKDFTKIAEEKAAGNASGVNTYKTEDDAPLNGKAYYRLKQIDLDGSYQYSKIVSVSRNTTSNEITLYPNPTAENLTVILPTLNKTELQVVNILGQIVLTGKFSNTNKAELNLNTLPAGTYQLVAIGENYRTVKKFVKLKN